MKYIKVEWPEVQDYMEREDFHDRVYYDCQKGCWFIPENWEPDYLKLKEVKENVFKSLMDDYLELGDDIGDLEDAMG